MNNTILDLFSCPVYKSEVNDYDNIQEEIARSLDNLINLLVLILIF